MDELEHAEDRSSVGWDGWKDSVPSRMTRRLNLSGGRNRATVNEKGMLQLLIPQANYLPPVQPAAGVHVSPWSRQRFLRRTCRWSQTWLHPAVRSGWWRSPGMAAGSWCQNQPPHEHMRATLPDWRCQDSEDVQFPCNPAWRRNKETVSFRHTAVLTVVFSPYLKSYNVIPSF